VRTLHEDVVTNSVLTKTAARHHLPARDARPDHPSMNFYLLWQEFPLFCAVFVGFSFHQGLTQKGATSMKTIITVVLLVLAATAAFA
jgi:hypothetical protein